MQSGRRKQNFTRSQHSQTQLWVTNPKGQSSSQEPMTGMLFSWRQASSGGKWGPSPRQRRITPASARYQVLPHRHFPLGPNTSPFSSACSASCAHHTSTTGSTIHLAPKARVLCCSPCPTDFALNFWNPSNSSNLHCQDPTSKVTIIFNNPHYSLLTSWPPDWANIVNCHLCQQIHSITDNMVF